MMGALSGFTVGITGHRRWEEQAEILTRRGARVIHGPTMSTTLLGDSALTQAATDEVLRAPVDIVVLTTGIGVRSWFSAADSWGVGDALRDALCQATVVVRGPKASSGAVAAGLTPAWSAPTETNAEVLARLANEGVSNRRVVVQRDGGEPWMAEEIAALGADVVDVPVYTWDLPEDLTPALRLLDAVCSGRVDAVTFTSSYAVQSAFDLATDPPALALAFDEQVLAVAVGPVTAATLRDHGVSRVVEPSRARLGSMIHALAVELERTVRTISLDGREWRWQGSLLIPDGAPAGTDAIALTRGEVRLLDVLVTRAPAVVAKTELVDEGVDAHAAEAAVARLRAKLGPLGAGVHAIRRRGYSCSIQLVPAS
jgi:uroporphyrinogen-III synthase